MRKIAIILLFLVAAGLAACNLPRKGDADINKEERIITAAARSNAAPAPYAG